MAATFPHCQWGRCTAPATAVVIYPAFAPEAPGLRTWRAGTDPLAVCAEHAVLAREEVHETRGPRPAEDRRA